MMFRKDEYEAHFIKLEIKNRTIFPNKNTQFNAQK